MIEASPWVIVGFSFLLILVTLLSGMWIYVGLGITGLVCALVFQGDLTGMIYIPFDTTNSFTMTAALTFIFMGEIILRSGISVKFFRGATALLQAFPGRLYHSVVAASAIFAATSGSSVASAATIGRIALPELNRRKYNQTISLGAICGGSTLANLIPPSVGLIIYGTCTHESVTRLFIGTVIPGLLITFMMMGYIVVRVRMSPESAPAEEKLPFREAIGDLVHIIPISLVVVCLLASLYRGIATPTEAGTVGAIAALVLAAFYRKLSLKLVVDSLIGATSVTSMLMMLIMVGYMIGGVYGALRLPDALAGWVAQAEIQPITVMIAIVVFYTVLGLFLETIPVFVISIGTIYPLIIALGYNGVWFGVFSTIILTAGMITPPVGLCLYVVQGIPPGYKIAEVLKGTLPFLDYSLSCLCSALDFSRAGAVAAKQNRAVIRTEEKERKMSNTYQKLKSPAEILIEHLTGKRQEDLDSLFAKGVRIFDPLDQLVSSAESTSKMMTTSKLWANIEDTEVVCRITRIERAFIEVNARVKTDDERKVIRVPISIHADLDHGLISEARVYYTAHLLGIDLHRPPIIHSDPTICFPKDHLGAYHKSLHGGDLEGVLARFEPNGYFKGPSGNYYRGLDELRKMFGFFFSGGDGIMLRYCTLTDDGVSLAIEYNYECWGKSVYPTEAGCAAYERGPSGKILCGRSCDEVYVPVESPQPLPGNRDDWGPLAKTDIFTSGT